MYTALPIVIPPEKVVPLKLVVTEKNIAAKKLAEILAGGRPKTGKVSNTAVYTFQRGGEEWMSIGLKGHVLGVDFPQQIVFGDGAWEAVWGDAAIKAPVAIPASLATPPWPRKKPFTTDGVDLKTWKLAALPYLVWAPIGKTPAELELIRALKSAARKADEIVIATDFDREGERLGNYAFLKTAEDQGDSTYQRMKGRYQHIATRAAEAASWMRPDAPWMESMLKVDVAPEARTN